MSDHFLANRVTTMHDFGYVALNMKYVNPEDAGTYICRAVNDLGEAVTSATMFVQCKYFPVKYKILLINFPGKNKMHSNAFNVK